MADSSLVSVGSDRLLPVASQDIGGVVGLGSVERHQIEGWALGSVLLDCG